MALRFKMNQPQKAASLKLTGFFLCVASNLLERQAPEYLNIWINGNLFRMDGESRISEIR